MYTVYLYTAVMKQQETTVISFRIPKELAHKVDKSAKRQKKVRAKFVEALFLPAFERHLEETKTFKQAA